MASRSHAWTKIRYQHPVGSNSVSDKHESSVKHGGRTAAAIAPRSGADPLQDQCGDAEATRRTAAGLTCEYANLSIEAVIVIEALIAMDKQLRDEAGMVEAMGLTAAEVAYYAAAANNQSAQDMNSDDGLAAMARDPTERLRSNLKCDWQYRQNMRARLRSMFKALLRRVRSPPDQDVTAIELLAQQTELISEAWARRDLGDRSQAAEADVLA